jgi:hypothetical protein
MKLIAAVGRSAKKDPRSWRKSANARLLAALHKLVFETIPEDPTRPEYRQGGALGRDRKHSFRAKFGGGRFRLFFRYSTSAKVIIFAWVNDETTLRTYFPVDGRGPATYGRHTQTIPVGETARPRVAPKEQPAPETLRQTDRRRMGLWKVASGRRAGRPPTK